MGGAGLSLPDMRSLLKRIQRRVLDATPLRRLVVPRYQFAFSPEQLAFINTCFLASHDIPGVSMEVGCFVGATTVFLNANYRYGREPRRYLAIDTFRGFTAADLAHEASQRGKDLSRIEEDSLFRMNSLDRFRYTMRINGLPQVAAIALDCNHIAALDLADPIAFALIDVDLYRPTRTALAYVLDHASPGAWILVDDCVADTPFDGSLQALEELSQERGIPFSVQVGKLGLIRVPA